MGLTTELNAQQLAAIRHASGPACILAGAGTGKTTVIAERFQRLVETGTAPGRILVLTFSRQAADEMRLRITSKLSGGYPRLCIGTFHSFCLEHLGLAASAAGLATPAVITDGARQVLLMPILGRISARYYAGIREREFLSDALTFIDRASDELVRPDEGLRLLKAFSAGELTDPSGSGRPAPADHIDRLADLVEAYRLYQEELQRRNALDYGAMVARLVERWRGHPDELARARAAFDQILVDEFQDTNGAQFELVRLLAAPDNRLMVVGDDDQAIYAFRGASDRFIRRFRDFYPDAAIYDLTENHRSHQRILDAANAAIAAA
ncbi:MAG: ATP-dependent helicase, partial [Chloroflexota bacterium]